MQAHQREDHHPRPERRHEALEGGGKQHEPSRNDEHVHRAERIDGFYWTRRFQTTPDRHGQRVGERRMLRLIQSKRERRFPACVGRRPRPPVFGVGQGPPVSQLLGPRRRLRRADKQWTEGGGHHALVHHRNRPGLIETDDVGEMLGLVPPFKRREHGQVQRRARQKGDDQGGGDEPPGTRVCPSAHGFRREHVFQPCSPPARTSSLASTWSRLPKTALAGHG